MYCLRRNFDITAIKCLNLNNIIMKICFITTGDIKNIATAKRALGLANPLADLGWEVSIIMENCEEHRKLLQLPEYVFPVVMLVFGWPTMQQKQRQKPARCNRKHIVHENTYRSMDGEELREMFAHEHKNRTYEEWCSAFCKRKYNSDFSKEMSRSVAKYLESYF